MVDEVGDPPLKFFKATERMKLVPPTTHRLGQGGIPGLKAAFVSILLLFHFFLQRFISVESHRTVWDTFAMRITSQRYDAICFANCFASYNMRKSTLRKRGCRLEQIANCFASYNMRRSTLRKKGRRLEQIANFFASYNMRRSTLRIYAFLLTCCFMGTI